MYNSIKNHEDVIVTILVTDNVKPDAINSITENTEHKLVTTSSEYVADTIATMRSSKLSIAVVTFDFSITNANDIVKVCMYNKVEIKDITSNKEIKRKDDGIESDAHLLADIYNEFSTDSNLSIVANAVRALVPVQKSFDEAVEFLSTIANIHLQIAEEKLNASISAIRNVVNSTTNLYRSTKLSTKEEMYLKVFHRAKEDVDTIELIKAQTGAEKTTQAQRLCRLAYRKRIKTCSITTLRNVAEQYAPKKAKTVIAHNEKSLAAFEQADHFSCTMHSLLKDHVFYTLKNCGYYIFDECEKNIQALFEDSSNTELEFLNSQQKEIIQSRLMELFSISGARVIAMDADASDAVSLRYLKSINKKVNAYDLDYSVPKAIQNQPKSLGMELVELARPYVKTNSNHQQNPYVNITTQIDNISMMKARLVEKKLVDADENMFIATDNKREAINMLKDSGYVKANGFIDEKAALKAKILLVHADNKGQSEQAAFVKNPNAEIAKYKTVIVTPCVREGFNITANYCETVIVLAHRILLPMSLVQMSRRLRTATNIIFALDTDLKPSFGFSNFHEDAEGLADKLETTFAVRKQVLLSDLVLSLTLTLENLGFNHKAPVRYDEEEKSETTKYQASSAKGHKEFVREATANAKCIDTEEAKRLGSCTSKSEEETYAVNKFNVAKKLAIDTASVSVKAVQFAEIFRKDHAIKFVEIFTGKIATKTKSKVRQSHDQRNLVASIKILVEALRGNIADENGNKIELDLTTEFFIADAVEVYGHLYANRAKFNKAFPDKDKIRVTESKAKAHDKATAERRVRAILKLLGIDYDRYGSDNNKRYKHFTHPLALSALTAKGLLVKDNSEEKLEENKSKKQNNNK